MTAIMPLLASGRQPVTQGPGSVRPSRLLATATRRPQLRAGLIGLVAGAIATGTMGVVVPLELHAAGESTGTIGLILFGTGLGYVAATGVILGSGARIVGTHTVLMTGVARAIVMPPCSLSRSVDATIAGAALITPLRGGMATLCFGLAKLGERSRSRPLDRRHELVVGAVWWIAPLGAGALSMRPAAAAPSHAHRWLCSG